MTDPMLRCRTAIRITRVIPAAARSGAGKRVSSPCWAKRPSRPPSPTHSSCLPISSPAKLCWVTCSHNTGTACRWSCRVVSCVAYLNVWRADPFCGVGTLPIHAAAIEPGAIVIGADRAKSEVNKTVNNLQLYNVHAFLSFPLLAAHAHAHTLNAGHACL